MKASIFGTMAASAVLSLIGSAAMAAETGQDMGGDAKACYRTHCGKSIKGHEGKCGGTRVDGLGTQDACEAAGGAWTTASDAKKYEKNKEG
jgi:hypothetical protein